jgi:hypothetical protein
VHAEVEIVVCARLLAEQSVYTPPALDPGVDPLHA